MGDKDYSGIYNNGIGITFEVKREDRDSDFVILRKQQDSSYKVTLGVRDVDNSSNITYEDTDTALTSLEIQTIINSLTPVDDKVYLAYYLSSKTYLLNGKNTFYVFKNIFET